MTGKSGQIIAVTGKSGQYLTVTGKSGQAKPISAFPPEICLIKPYLAMPGLETWLLSTDIPCKIDPREGNKVWSVHRFISYVCNKKTASTYARNLFKRLMTTDSEEKEKMADSLLPSAHGPFMTLAGLEVLLSILGNKVSMEHRLLFDAEAKTDDKDNGEDATEPPSLQTLTAAERVEALEMKRAQRKHLQMETLKAQLEFHKALSADGTIDESTRALLLAQASKNP